MACSLAGERRSTMGVGRHSMITRLADPMTEYSIGIEDHYAWANLVSVTTSGPNEIVLDKRRVELLDEQLASAPYHHETLHMPLSGAEKLVRDVKTSANDRAK